MVSSYRLAPMARLEIRPIFRGVRRGRRRACSRSATALTARPSPCSHRSTRIRLPQPPRWRRWRRGTTPRAPWRSAATASSASCSAPAATTRSGARTSGSSSPGTRSRRPRICATSTPPPRRAGSRRAARGTTRSYRRTTLRWSTPGFASRSASSTRPASARCPTWPGRTGCAGPSRATSTRSLRSTPLLGDHQAASPVFARGFPADDPDELRAELLADLVKDEIGELVFERDEMIVGAFESAPVEMSSVHVGLRDRPVRRCSGGPRRSLGPRIGSRARAHRRHVRMGERARSRDDRHRLAGDEPALVALLAGRGFRPTFLRLYRAIP